MAVCTALSVISANSVGRAAIHARISLDKVLCAPVFRPLFPLGRVREAFPPESGVRPP